METSKIQFVPTFKTKEGIVTGEIRTCEPIQQTICSCEEINAQRIVKAVNMHDELISMLKKNHETLLSVYANAKFGANTINEQSELRDEMKNILQLIEKAEQK